MSKHDRSTDQAERDRKERELLEALAKDVASIEATLADTRECALSATLTVSELSTLKAAVVDRRDRLIDHGKRLLMAITLSRRPEHSSPDRRDIVMRSLNLHTRQLRDLSRIYDLLATAAAAAGIDFKDL